MLCSRGDVVIEDEDDVLVLFPYHKDVCTFKSMVRYFSFLRDGCLIEEYVVGNMIFFSAKFDVRVQFR